MSQSMLLIFIEFPASMVKLILQFLDFYRTPFILSSVVFYQGIELFIFIFISIVDSSALIESLTTESRGRRLVLDLKVSLNLRC